MLVPFSPPPGLNSDDTAFKAEGRWADCNNVRFVEGAAQIVGAFKAFGSVGTLTAVSNMLAFNRSSTLTMAYATASKLYVGSGSSAPSDRTPVGLGTIYTWSLAEWGSTLLASPGGGKLYEQSGASTATEVVNAPDVITAMLVTPQRQVLALGCNEEVSTTFNPLCIRGSDLEDYTDWTTTATNNAFEHILEGPGEIVTGRMVGDYVAVWTTSALYLGQFVGDPSQTYRFDRVTSIPAPIGANAACVLNGVAYWLGSDMSVYQWTPGALPAQVPCSVTRELAIARPSADANRRRIVVCSNSAFNEVWIHGLNGTYPYYAFNTKDYTWFKGNFARSAMLDSGAVAGTTAGGTPILMALDAVYEHDAIPGSIVSTDGPTAFHITSAYQYLDNSQRRMMVRRYVPDFGTQTHYLTIYTRNRPDSTPTTWGPYTIDNTKKDFRASGLIMAVKLSLDSNANSQRLGKPLFDVVPTGER